MAWFWLVMAGLLEVVWAIAMKQSHGFTRWLPTVVMLVTMGIGFGMLTLALRQIPLGTGYAVWVGIGAVGTALAGVWVFGESINTARILFLAMIVLGIVGLRLTESGSA